MSAPSGFNVDNPQCAICSGRMWDNREKKRNPKAPDFKCRDKSCGGAVWMDADEKKSAKATEPPAQTTHPQSQLRQPQPTKHRMGKDEYWTLQRECFQLGVSVVRSVASDVNLGLSDFEVAGLAQDLMAQALIGLDHGMWTLDEPQAEQVQPMELSPGKAAAGYAETLKIMATDGDCDSVREMFMADAAVSEAERPALLHLWLERKKAIARKSA